MCHPHKEQTLCNGPIADSASCILAASVVAESSQLVPQFILFVDVEQKSKLILNSPPQRCRVLRKTSAHSVVASLEEKKSKRPSRPTVQRPEFWPGSNVSVRPRLSPVVWRLAHEAFACISSSGQDIYHPETNRGR